MAALQRRTCDVAVIGAGVIGLAVAWRTARAGRSVVLLDRDEPAQGTSHVAAGMIAPVSEALASERALLRLALSSARAYPGFIGELERESGLEAGYLRCGSLMVARDADEAEALERELAIRQELGLRAVRLLGSRARLLEPSLARVRLALELGDDHAVDPRILCRALLEATGRAGGELAQVEVLELEPRDDSVVLRCAGGATLQAGHAVVAAGVKSARIAGPPERLGDWLRPVKGQILRLHDPAGPGAVTRVLRLADAYVVPRGDGRYVIGATTEERGFDRTVTAGGMWEMLRSATEAVPGISEWVLDEASAGLRPGTRDNAPLLGADPASSRVIWATGHHRHGVLLAPVTAELVSAWVHGRTLGGELATLAPSFSPARAGGESSSPGTRVHVA